MITSDHNPLDVEHKKVEFENAAYGTIGLESLFGATQKAVDLESLISCLTDKPRSVFGLEKTKIEVGTKANITLFNPDFTYTFSEDYILSKSNNSIFHSKKLSGIAYVIICESKLVLS